jgi:hypothetical protein
MDATKILLEEYGQGPLRRHLGFNPIKMGSTTAMAMDNNFKIGGFLHRLFDKGDTMEEAASWVRKTYYNYDEVGEATKTLSGVLPFARWSRLNIPRMMELMTSPSQWWKIDKLTMGPLSRRAEEESAAAEADTLPDWILEKHHVVVGRRDDGSTSVIYGVGLPIEDLNKLFARTPKATVENLLSETSPFLRWPLEGWIFDKSVFTGDTISDPSYRNFYRRADNMTHDLPPLKAWLGVEKQEHPDGRVTYRSNNPVAMYTFASFIGRPFQSIAKLRDIGTAVDSAQGISRALDFATGLKIRDVFPPPEEHVPMAQRALEDPMLGALVNQYYSIPLYGPEANMTPQQSTQASAGYQQARYLANSLRYMSEAAGTPISDEDAMEYGLARLEEIFPYGERAPLARRVWAEGLTATGRKMREEFAKANPLLLAAMRELSPDQLTWITGILDHRNLPSFLR